MSPLRAPDRSREIPRPKTRVSKGVIGNVVVPSWAGLASLLTAGMAKYFIVIVVSPRRWQHGGLIRQTLRNWTLTALAAMGVHPDRLAAYYPVVR